MPPRPDESISERARAGSRRAEFFVRLGFELVFVGVYAAFALSEYENRRDAAARRLQLQAALVREIQDITTRTRRVAAVLPQFYNELNAGFEQLAQLRALSETVLIPNLGRGSDEFYDATGRMLAPKYARHREGLERLAGLAENITALGDSLVDTLTTTP